MSSYIHDFLQILQTLQFSYTEYFPHFHPVSCQGNIAWLLSNEGKVDDIVTLQAAILYETIQHSRIKFTKTTFDNIESKFGKEVALIVLKLQKPRGDDDSYKANLIILAEKISDIRKLAKDLHVGWSHEKMLTFSWGTTSKDICRQIRMIDDQKHHLEDMHLASSFPEFFPKCYTL